jgi:hypothetical protein
MPKQDVAGDMLIVFVYVMAAVLLIIALASLQGCTLIQPANEIRVTEYGGDGSYLMQASGQVSGCRAVQNGEVNGCLRFKGATCNFVSEGCK